MGSTMCSKTYQYRFHSEQNWEILCDHVTIEKDNVPFGLLVTFASQLCL